jgi:hypothetical protein
MAASRDPTILRWLGDAQEQFRERLDECAAVPVVERDGPVAVDER